MHQHKSRPRPLVLRFRILSFRSVFRRSNRRLCRCQLRRNRLASHRLDFLQPLLPSRLLARFFPVLPANANAPDRIELVHRHAHPLVRGGEGELRRQKQGSEEYREHDEIRPDGVERCGHARGDQVSQHSTGRNGAAHLRQMPQREQARQREHEHCVANQFGDRRIVRPAPEPPEAQGENPHGQQERRIPEALKQQVRAVRADRPDPIACRPRIARRRRHVKRRVVRAVGKQGQRDQYGYRDAEKAHHLVQTVIFRWSQYAHTILLFWGRKKPTRDALRATGHAGAGARGPSGGISKAGRIYQTGSRGQQRSSARVSGGNVRRKGCNPS